MAPERRALIVDLDDYFVSLLKSAGYDVTFTSDYEGGLEALQRDEFDLHVFELDLPPIDDSGRALLRAVSVKYGAERLLDDERGPYVWMTVVSGKKPEYIEEFEKFGATQIFVAPVESIMVKRALEKLAY